MNSKKYFHRTPTNKIICIEPSQSDASCWALRFGAILISEKYGSAEEAALCAYNKDFESPVALRLFANVWVPYHLGQWMTSLPEQGNFENIGETN